MKFKKMDLMANKIKKMESKTKKMGLIENKIKKPCFK